MDYGLTNVTLIPTEEYFWDPYYRWSVIDHSPPDGYERPDQRPVEEVYPVWPFGTTFLQDSNEKPSR